MDNKKAETAKDKHAAKRPVYVTVFRWAIVVVWAGVIFFLSSNTGSGLSSDLGFFSGIYQALKGFQESLFGPGVDVLSPVGHFMEYFILSFLLVNALWQHMSLKKACLVALACASLYGVTDEIHQYFVPERMCDPLDWLVDTLGAGLGSLLAYPLLQKIDSMRDAKQ